MMGVQKAASKWTVVLLKGSDRTCFLIGTTASVADYLEDDFAVIPFTCSMKMRIGREAPFDGLSNRIGY